jgi:hypothetical protein
MATDLVKNNAYSFLDNFLSRPASSIPKGAQWAVSFDGLGSVLPAIKKAYDYEPQGLGKWKTLDAATTILTDEYQTSRGCLFCQAIALPGEGQTPIAEGIQSNAFIRSWVGAGRNDFPIMRMTFLDTHVSFADSFLRGWSLATSNFGLIARSDIPYRTNLTCYKFGITPKGPFVIQTMKFQGICCVSVSEEEYQYTPPSSPVLREAKFVYNNYMIDTESGNANEFLLNGRVEPAEAVRFPNLQYQKKPSTVIRGLLDTNPNMPLGGVAGEQALQGQPPVLAEKERQQIAGYTSTDKLLQGFSQTALDLQNDISKNQISTDQALASQAPVRATMISNASSNTSTDQALASQAPVRATMISNASSNTSTDIVKDSIARAKDEISSKNK